MAKFEDDYALVKRLEKELTAVLREIEPLERRSNRIFIRLEAARKRVGCKDVSGCTRLAGHPGCHVR